MWVIVKRVDFKYSPPRKILQHTEVQKTNRVNWSRHYRNTQRLSFKKVQSCCTWINRREVYMHDGVAKQG
jgi:hypothetical protein